MSGQPAQTDISVYRALRSQRNPRRNASVAALTKDLTSLVMVIPGKETGVIYGNRDSAVSDLSPYMGPPTRTGRGFPVTIDLRKCVSYAYAQTHLADVDFGFTIGRDRFITNTSAGLSGDLFGDAGALTDSSCCN